MLTGTDLPADHVVGKIIPRLGKAEVEKIAINAVMAGALPTYMPLLIAGVQALIEPKADFGTFEVSTGSWALFWIINGPVRHDLNVNSGSGALSPGDITNAAIGRAMGLIIKNIGGARKGIEDMGVLGNPGKYTMVIAESQEDCPIVIRVPACPMYPLLLQQKHIQPRHFPAKMLQRIPYYGRDCAAGIPMGLCHGSIQWRSESVHVTPGQAGQY